MSTAPRAVEVRERPDPAPADGEVVVRVLACGICGSDVNEGWVARKVPVVLGHELAGEVVASRAPGVAVGERVVVHHHAPCGACERCRRGSETLCAQFARTRLDPGGFAELVRVPAELVPELLPLGGLDAERATFAEPLACVLRALGRARLREEDRLVVVGCGSSGLLAVLAARARGVREVLVREPRADRLARAVALGARRHGEEEADVVLVCTAKPAAIEDGFRAVAPGGTLVLYGVPEPGDVLALDALRQYVREVAVVASYSAGPQDMRAALDLLQDGLDPLGLVTHRLPLDEVARGLELQRTGEAVKVLVVP